jgi:hypothetical protein
MAVDINLKKEKRRRTFKIGLIFSLSWIIGLVVFFITFFSRDDDYIEVAHEPGMVIGGSIAYDGRYYWATRLLVSFGAEIKREILQFTAAGDIEFFFTPQHDFRGLAFDNERLWTAEAYGSQDYLSDKGNFYTIDRTSGQFTGQFAIHRDYLLDAITAGNGRLWVLGRYDTQEKRVFLWEIDHYIGSIVHEVEISDNIKIPCSGIAFLDGYVWAVVGSIDREVVKISPQDGRILESHDFSGYEINGIASDGNTILLADGDKNQLRALEAFEQD